MKIMTIGPITTTFEETVVNLKELVAVNNYKSVSSANNQIHLEKNTEPLRADRPSQYYDCSLWKPWAVESSSIVPRLLA